MPLPRRFDASLMYPPDAVAGAGSAPLPALLDWCGERDRPAPPAVVRVASLPPHPGLDAAACWLDGSRELARLGRWRGLGWRLRILWRERLEGRADGRATRPGDPWDCGWWRDGAFAAAAAFRPRRATLLMLHEPTPAVAAALLGTLRTHSGSYARPLHVLVVSASPPAGTTRL